MASCCNIFFAHVIVERNVCCWYWYDVVVCNCTLTRCSGVVKNEVKNPLHEPAMNIYDNGNEHDNNDKEDNVLLFLLWLVLLITILLYIWRFTISKDEKTVVLIMDVATRGGTMSR